MTGTGLNELLEVVLVNNTKAHMMSGKGLSRAIGGHLLVDAALNAILTSQAFQVDVKHVINPAEVDATLPSELEEVGVLYDDTFSKTDI